MEMVDLTHNSSDLEDDIPMPIFRGDIDFDDLCSSPDSLPEYEFTTKIDSIPLSSCYGCGGVIEDRFVLHVNYQTWHQTCLRCSHCYTILDNHTKCYIRNNNFYCSQEEFASETCAKCLHVIRSDEWVRKAHNNCYHLACFRCDMCKRQLPTGEQFALHDNRLLCKIHYLQTIQDKRLGKERRIKRRAKRTRTAFSDDQVQIFQSFFNFEQNPDPQELDTLAEQAGVERRVAQVWFQNARARSKKTTYPSFLSPISVSSKDSYSSSEQSYGSTESLLYSD